MFKTRKDSVEEVLKLMDSYGISKAVVFPGTEIEPDNRWMADAIRSHRDRLLPFAWINPILNQEKAMSELVEMVEKNGFMGMKLHPLFHSFYPNRQFVVPLVEKCAEYGIPVTVHSGHAPYSMPWQIAELAEMCPNASIIMDHMGLQVGWVEDAITLAQKYSNIILGTTAMPFHEKIRYAVKQLGAERVIYGSDAPSIHPLPEIDRVRVAGLMQEELSMVLGGSLARILKIDGKR